MICGKEFFGESIFITTGVAVFVVVVVVITIVASLDDGIVVVVDEDVKTNEFWKNKTRQKNK